MEMRQALCECLDEMMAENENIVVIDADLAKPNGTFPLRSLLYHIHIDIMMLVLQSKIWQVLPRV